jgi:glycosyltransferase involved in cell wall biosynthesis
MRQVENMLEKSVKKSDYPIIVHCHLRWDFVWQRPQQFLSRFSKRHRVLFCEGPLLHDESKGERNFAPYYTLRRDEKFPNVTVMQTHFPASRFGDAKWVDAQRLQLLCAALDKELGGKFEHAVQWFYDPMAAPIFLNRVGEVANVYDCMDQLSQFKFAPPELARRERVLLHAADVVFTGGRKMWEDKIQYNDNCHFYGCGVDVAHFSAALEKSTRVPRDLALLKRPTLGYFGVVDERLDYDLIEQLADANPEWSICMIGPTCKVDPKDLPQRPNLHWMGGREYSQLPSYTKGFDVCLMPFAMNEATEFINPTKALEYMATGTPIISTAVPDVVSNFASVVKVANTADEFIALCRQNLNRPDGAAIQRGLKMANENTWEMIVAKMESHIAKALERRSVAQRVEMPGAQSAAQRVLQSVGTRVAATA